MATKPNIAIIGAGPGGLTLARILLINGVPFTIFEREESPDSRQQGGTLDLHVETGQAAVQKAELWNEFQKTVRYEGEDTVISDRHANIVLREVGEDTGRPEVDRIMLRKMLLNSIPADYIRWGQNLRSVEAGKLHFQHGTETGFDLIVGADGAWSKVRPYLTYVKPFYSGIGGTEIRLREADEKHPEQSKLVGNGSMYCLGEEDGLCLICQRTGDRAIRIYAFGQKPEDWTTTCGIDFNSGQQARKEILKDYAHWSPTLQELVRRGDDDLIPRSLYMLPVGLRWSPKPGVTLLGDAAHLMTPFAGEGVNVAMDDAKHLAEAILNHPGDVNEAIQEYEAWMLPNAREKTQDTWDSLLTFFEKGAAQKFKDIMSGGPPPEA